MHFWIIILFLHSFAFRYYRYLISCSTTRSRIRMILSALALNIICLFDFELFKKNKSKNEFTCKSHVTLLINNESSFMFQVSIPYQTLRWK